MGSIHLQGVSVLPYSDDGSYPDRDTLLKLPDDGLGGFQADYQEVGSETGPRSPGDQIYGITDLGLWSCATGMSLCQATQTVKKNLLR